jgi:DNA-binding Xre family transcriptional regulator
MQVHSRLREIMRERGLGVKELLEMSGVGRDAIAALRGNKWQRVSRAVMGKICAALNITFNDLFILNPEDIWAPIKLSGEVTIHYGSRSETRLLGSASDDFILAGQWIGVWDMRAANLIIEYLKRAGLEVNVIMKEHVTGLERGYDPSVRDSIRQIFESGNHVVIGSPIANQFTEEVVCYAFGVTPYAPNMREAFPYGFVWDSRRRATSSFGWQGVGNEFGIWSTRAERLVARCTIVKEGQGQDCALILVYRIFVPQARREHGSDAERVVICILGHSGAGTYAGANAAIDSKYAGELYPAERGKPHMRVISATYTRAPSETPRDNREVTGAELVEESQPKPASGAPPRGSHRRRPRKGAKQSAPLHPKSVHGDRSGRTESGAHVLFSAARGR